VNLKSAFPVIVMGFVLLTGAFFLVAGLGGIPFLSVDAARTPAVTILAVLLVAVSVLFYFAWQQGRLRKQGKTLLEVRLQAVEKAKEPSTLVKIAEDPDEHPNVRKRAGERLKELME
jgi:membrane protein implicated in regulation of membrane protease activity